MTWRKNLHDALSVRKYPCKTCKQGVAGLTVSSVKAWQAILFRKKNLPLPTSA
jgi:hypothetical protein